MCGLNVFQRRHRCDHRDPWCVQFVAQRNRFECSVCGAAFLPQDPVNIFCNFITLIVVIALVAAIVSLVVQ